MSNSFLPATLRRLWAQRDAAKDASKIGNARVLLDLAAPAYRGFVQQVAKGHDTTAVTSRYDVMFDWTYAHDGVEFAKLYEQAKSSQWRAEDLAWNTAVDAMNPRAEVLPEADLPFADLPGYQRLTPAERTTQRHAYASWLLSQFLHGEQGALLAACQVTTAVSSLDGRLYGSTQVVDEGRHVEVFERYLTTKLGRRYEVNDNLYVIIDALISDARWDVKFLGMQIMIEGLALAAFGYLRSKSSEPLLKEMLRYVISDEARHVHFGVLALQGYCADHLSPREQRHRQDWAYEMALLLRNRFLLQELYDEYYAHTMSRRAWEAHLLASPAMREFRQRLFKRIIPNLKKIGLLPERMRPHYQQLGLLEFETEADATQVTAEELLT